MKWRWHSNTESADAGIISVLAIVETLIAMCLFGWILSLYGQFPLTLACCIVPFILLRTEESTELALNWAKRVHIWIDRKDRAWHGISESGQPNSSSPRRGSDSSLLENPWTQLEGQLEELSNLQLTGCAVASLYVTVFLLKCGDEILPFCALLGCIVGAVCTMPFKIAATLVTVMRQPMKSIAAISDNWLRIVACVDVVHPPELLPGLVRRLREDRPSDFVFHEFITQFYLGVLDLARQMKVIRRSSLMARVATLVVAPLFAWLLITFLAFTVPAWIYRVSLKGISLVLFPVIWAVR